ncbi:hypothetical protein, partial [Nonomuraea rubra]|uniref:hypothetical protein n=1 Tax=Nonomuraea rubra TaxID=46180 RepID=UPI0031EAE6C7
RGAARSRERLRPDPIPPDVLAVRRFNCVAEPRASAGRVPPPSMGEAAGSCEAGLAKVEQAGSG